MPPPLDPPAPEAEDLLDGDWFGEGSVFDTGEDLANALMVLASAQAAGTARALALSPGPHATPEPAVGLDGVHTRPPQRGPAPLAAPDEFQVATMPSSRGREPSGWAGRPSTPVGRRSWSGAGPGSQRTGWSIRQSVQTLRIAEDTLCKLREEAAQLAWHFAAAAHEETDASS
jgi:hypothetical protein